MAASPWNLCVFRETRRGVALATLVEALLDDVRGGRGADALVRSGEIESALADANAPEAAAAAALTDALATALVAGRECEDEPVRSLAQSLSSAAELCVVPPEGFSYYGLHPRDFADRMASPPLDDVREAAVIGLRSIGTTLSAVVCAALRARGARAQRWTVRPSGTPYARFLRLDSRDARWVDRQVGSGAEFIVVDEGPGLSGSSLLAVVDALVALGVPGERITVVCTRDPDPSKLLASEAPRRWRRVRAVAVRSAPRIPVGYAGLPPGGWRRRFLGADARWPACWPWLERAKAVSSDGRTLLKFEGLGRHGADAARRAAMAAQAGFGPSVGAAVDGRVGYEIIAGRASCACRLDERTIDRLADYCAWRSCSLHAVPSSNGDVDEMVRVNAAVAMGVDLHIALALERPVVADAHMMPHEWIEDPQGALWKTDAASHGDDHLFPGPTDAAWDLAGAIVEFRMPRAAIERFLTRYTRRSGDRAEARLPSWLVAYALHRLAWAELAAANVESPAEQERLRHESESRRRWLRVAAGMGLLGRGGAALAAPA
jgi:hypothetical protein